MHYEHLKWQTVCSKFSLVWKTWVLGFWVSQITNCLVGFHRFFFSLSLPHWWQISCWQFFSLLLFRKPRSVVYLFCQSFPSLFFDQIEKWLLLLVGEVSKNEKSATKTHSLLRNGRASPTVPFTVLKPRNPSINEFHVARKSHWTD